jgi:hypothetical protein
MIDTETASEQITRQVMSWPGVRSGHGSRGEFAFKLGTHELGHLHGDRSAHFFFPAKVGLELKAEGRVADHPVFPGKPGPAARSIRDDADVRDVVELLRLNYERLVARYGSATAAAH